MTHDVIVLPVKRAGARNAISPTCAETGESALAPYSVASPCADDRATGFGHWPDLVSMTVALRYVAARTIGRPCDPGTATAHLLALPTTP